MNILVVGCGYLGTEISRVAPQQWNLYALTRSPERAGELSRMGFRPRIGDWLSLEPQSLAADAHRQATATRAAQRRVAEQEQGDLRSPFDAVLVSVPHRPVEPHGEQTHVVGLRHLLDSLRPSPPRLVYVSTTGVFGQSATGTIDEASPAAPDRVGGRIALEAEEWVQENWPAPAVIARSAGIYGPGRLPLLASLRSGEPLPVDPDALINLIHVHDLARVVIRMLGQPPASPLYLVSDGHPVRRREFYNHLAQRFGLAPPRFAPPDQRIGRGRSYKQISPQRLIDQLGYQFVYPDYRAGLAEISASR